MAFSTTEQTKCDDIYTSEVDHKKNRQKPKKVMKMIVLTLRVSLYSLERVCEWYPLLVLSNVWPVIHCH